MIVECAVHGDQGPAFVCRHLNLEERIGFIEGYDPADPELDSWQAWCSECDAVLMQEGEWNDRSEDFARPRLVCRECYLAMKRLNRPA